LHKIELKGCDLSFCGKCDSKRSNIRAIAVEPKKDKRMRMNAQTGRAEARPVYHRMEDGRF
jgi:hypothetical protein